MHTIEFFLNGSPKKIEVEDNLTLLELLRDRFGLISPKEGCGIGECGACTVLMNKRPIYSCLTLAIKAHGQEIITVEGLKEDPLFFKLQEAFVEKGAVQCGYCTPGMLISGYALLLEGRDLDQDVIKEGISGNLCRCTGYIQIIEAIRDAARV